MRFIADHVIKDSEGNILCGIGDTVAITCTAGSYARGVIDKIDYFDGDIWVYLDGHNIAINVSFIEELVVYPEGGNNE